MPTLAIDMSLHFIFFSQDVYMLEIVEDVNYNLSSEA